MKNKLAKLKYLPNNYEILESGDHVICAVSNKRIPLENLTYWNFYIQFYIYFKIQVSYILL